MNAIPAPHQQVFISHATPEDNAFAGWLASKLSLAGYQVWCDLEDLGGGDDFWKNIESAIRENAAKFLFVLSPASLRKRGTMKELAIADGINQDRGGRGPGFIIPLRIGDVSAQSLPSELIRLTYIDFYIDWGLGLTELLAKLNKESTPRSAPVNAASSVAFWSKGMAVRSNIMRDRAEGYRTNWFEVKLPQFVYAHRLGTRGLDIQHPPEALGFLDAGRLISFACDRCVSRTTVLDGSTALTPPEFLASTSSEGRAGDGIAAPNRKLIRLMNEAFCSHLIRKGLTRYDLARDSVYYFHGKTDSRNPRMRVGLRHFGRLSIQLWGHWKDALWHYAIGAQAFLYPFPAFAVDYHAVFTRPRDGSLLPVELQHRYRRQLAKDWYNKKWRDLLLGAFCWLAGGGETASLDLAVCEHQALIVKATPVRLESSIGYLEPTTIPTEDEDGNEPELS
jgi:hypothetical protein